jgi:hypothetical protein
MLLVFFSTMGPNAMFHVPSVVLFFCVACFIINSIVRPFRLFLQMVLQLPFLPPLPRLWLGHWRWMLLMPFIWVLFDPICICGSFHFVMGSEDCFSSAFGSSWLRLVQHYYLTFILIFPLVVSCLSRLGWHNWAPWY